MKKYNEHNSVLLNESIDVLNIIKDGIYVDCTLGRAGHSQSILKKLSNDGKLICFDKDIEAIEYAKNIFKNDHRVVLINDSFSNIKKRLEEKKIFSVNGILFDLGVSSPQLDNPNRGFSYKNNSPLDMRMNQSQELDACKIVNNYSENDLKEIFDRYGECKYSKLISSSIIKNRMIKQIETTFELVDIIKSSLPNSELNKKKHPARTYFQALRIAVNNELDDIYNAINQSIELLKDKSRIVVISFHSLEGKIVKKIFKEITKDSNPSYLPIKENNIEFKIIKSPNISDYELDNNRRARSANMHIIERNKYGK